MRLQVLALDYDETIATHGMLHPDVRAYVPRLLKRLRDLRRRTGLMMP